MEVQDRVTELEDQINGLLSTYKATLSEDKPKAL